MTMIVTTPPNYILTGTVKLRASLCYENEKLVEVGACASHARARGAGRLVLAGCLPGAWCQGPTGFRPVSQRRCCCCGGAVRGVWRAQEVDQDILNLLSTEASCHEISLENTSAVFEFRLEKVWPVVGGCG